MSLFTQDAGKAFGTSPFMVLSRAKYPRQPNARTVWGASLTDVFKYEVDGDTFRFAGSFEINKLPLWVGWNLFTLPGDRVVVPNPSGLRIGRYRGTPCYGTAPSLMVFQDGPTPVSPIECVHAFEFTQSALSEACGFRRTAIGTTAVLTGELLNGEVAVTIVEERGRGRRKEQITHLAVLDPDLSRIVACAPVGQGTASNQFPVDRDASGASIAYVATETEIVKMRRSSSQGTFERVDAARTNFRGRTGTTPTLMDTSDGRRLLIVVDGRCAVTKVFTGEIECSEDNRPSELVVLDRDNLSAQPLRVPLPEIIDTVENSPAVLGGDIVVANYSGYTPDGIKDGSPDFARGIVKLRWTGTGFAQAWLRNDLQISGIPTISSASQMVYSSGAEADGNTYVYGLDLATGETRYRALAGPSKSTSERLRDGVFDAGNNTLINDDGSAIFPAGETLVRAR
ncbi:MAG: hypothetical protein AAGL68_06800 [Pseudomonadota bacterium]